MEKTRKIKVNSVENDKFLLFIILIVSIFLMIAISGCGSSKGFFGDSSYILSGAAQFMKDCQNSYK